MLGQNKKSEQDATATTVFFVGVKMVNFQYSQQESTASLRDKYELHSVMSFVMGAILLILLGIRVAFSPSWLPASSIGYFVAGLIVCILSYIYAMVKYSQL